MPFLQFEVSKTSLFNLNFLIVAKAFVKCVKPYQMYLLFLWCSIQYRSDDFIVNFIFFLNLFIDIQMITECHMCAASLPVDVISVEWLRHRDINHTVRYSSGTFSLLAIWWDLLSNTGNSIVLFLRKCHAFASIFVVWTFQSFDFSVQVIISFHFISRDKKDGMFFCEIEDTQLYQNVEDNFLAISLNPCLKRDRKNQRKNISSLTSHE